MTVMHGRKHPADRVSHQLSSMRGGCQSAVPRSLRTRVMCTCLGSGRSAKQISCSCTATEDLPTACAQCSIPALPPGCTPAPPAASDAVDCAACSGQDLAPATDGPAPLGAPSQAPGDHARGGGLPQAASPPARAAATEAGASSAPLHAAGLGSTAVQACSASTPAGPAELGSLSLARLLLDRRAGSGGGVGEGEGGSRAA